MKNAMQLKAIIKNFAKEKHISAQLVMQNYMLERLLERISISEYQPNFILKRGFLIAAMVGLDIDELKAALLATAEKRGSIEVLMQYPQIIDTVKNNKAMQRQWVNYQKDFEYAEDIEFEDTCSITDNGGDDILSSNIQTQMIIPAARAVLDTVVLTPVNGKLTLDTKKYEVFDPKKQKWGSFNNYRLWLKTDSGNYMLYRFRRENAESKCDTSLDIKIKLIHDQTQYLGFGIWIL